MPVPGLVGQRQQRAQVAALLQQPCRLGQRPGPALRRRQRARTERRKLCASCIDARVKLIGRHDLGHQPEPAASSAVTRRPVSARSSAARSPACCTSSVITIPGTSPSKTSGYPSDASSDADREVAAPDDPGPAGQGRPVDGRDHGGRAASSARYTCSTAPSCSRCAGRSNTS